MSVRTTPKRRVVVSGTIAGRVIKAPGASRLDELALDDRPIAIQPSNDGRQVIVILPYELWILDARSMTVQRTIALDIPRPSVAEGWEGALWIAGLHLFRGNLHSSTTTKIGTKLGGWVDHVGMIRADLLAGVGSQGEILWDIDSESPIHQRKSTGGEPLGVVVGPEKAVFSDGSSNCWVIDPSYKLGYSQLKLAATSSVPVAREAIVCLGKTSEQRIILAARDGAVAWTNPDLRLARERFATAMLAARTSESEPIAVTGDERWVYVLRPKGLLQRFLIAQPPIPKADKRLQKGKLKDHGRKPEPEPEPLPDAQEVRLDTIACCLAILPDDADASESSSDADAETSSATRRRDPKKLLVLGGGRADNQLGRLWAVDPESLAWTTIQLGQRSLVEPAPPPESGEPVAKERPSFVTTKNKLAGPKISEISVDDIVTGDKVDFWLTHGHGSLLDRPTERRPISEALPGDAILLPAMVRFSQGGARPALLLWPGVVDDHEGEPPKPQWLVWGDDPRGWISLDTPALRKQKWSRNDVFPMQAAIAAVPSGAPGKRAKIDERWIDRGHFDVLAKECKRLLKVLW